MIGVDFYCTYNPSSPDERQKYVNRLVENDVAYLILGYLEGTGRFIISGEDGVILTIGTNNMRMCKINGDTPARIDLRTPTQVEISVDPISYVPPRSDKENEVHVNEYKEIVVPKKGTFDKPIKKVR